MLLIHLIANNYICTILHTQPCLLFKRPSMSYNSASVQSILAISTYFSTNARLLNLWNRTIQMVRWKRNVIRYALYLAKTVDILIIRVEQSQWWLEILRLEGFVVRNDNCPIDILHEQGRNHYVQWNALSSVLLPQILCENLFCNLDVLRRLYMSQYQAKE